jgi:hypothetical protein
MTKRLSQERTTPPKRPVRDRSPRVLGRFMLAPMSICDRAAGTDAASEAARAEPRPGLAEAAHSCCDPATCCAASEKAACCEAEAPVGRGSCGCKPQ